LECARWRGPSHAAPRRPRPAHSKKASRPAARCSTATPTTWDCTRRWSWGRTSSSACTWMTSCRWAGRLRGGRAKCQPPGRRGLYGAGTAGVRCGVLCAAPPCVRHAKPPPPAAAAPCHATPPTRPPTHLSQLGLPQWLPISAAREMLLNRMTGHVAINVRGGCRGPVAWRRGGFCHALAAAPLVMWFSVMRFNSFHGTGGGLAAAMGQAGPRPMQRLGCSLGRCGSCQRLSPLRGDLMVCRSQPGAVTSHQGVVCG
jgi:hypothetical protein